MSDKTPQEMAAKYVLEMDPSDFVDRAPDDLAQEIYLAGLAEGKRLGLEESRALCLENADGYRSLQTRAREAGDTQAALAHLCEKDACLILARELRALLPKDAPSAGEREDG